MVAPVQGDSGPSVAAGNDLSAFVMQPAKIKDNFS